MRTLILKRLSLVAFLLGLALATTACQATVGVGVGVAYPGPWYGPWHGGIYVGGPIYP